MPTALTIVMYHYIRDFSRTRYPGIKGLDVGGFRRQLDYLEQAYNIVRMEEVMAALFGDVDLPPDAALLTFDDGYREHFDTAFPILHDRGLQGSFFPPVAPVRDGALLNVNRVHFILASVASAASLGAAVDDAVRAADDPDVGSVEAYRAEWAHSSRFDDAETIYVKRMLQTALPPAMREAVARELFDRFVGVDEATFAAEQYMNEDQARLMVDCGMFFGSHGRSHFWLDQVDQPTREHEIKGSLAFLADIGMPVDEGWVMCYPFGGWDQQLVETLRQHRCTVGLTTRVGVAQIGVDDPLTLPRFDTNDFPR